MWREKRDDNPRHGKRQPGRRLRHMSFTDSSTNRTTIPAVIVITRSSGCSGPNRNRSLANDHRRVRPSATVTTGMTIANVGFGRRNRDTTDAPNDLLTRIRLIIASTNEKNASDRASASG